VLATALFAPAQIPDFTPPTPLIGAVLGNDTSQVKQLLASGANPNEGQFFGSPALLWALRHHNTEMVQALITAGADINTTDAVGSTALMWAAYNESPDSALVPMLLKLGADPNAKNKKGETALTWAMNRGYSAIAQSLVAGGATSNTAIRESAEKAIALLQRSGPGFLRVSGCTSCHNQSLPQMAWSIARERGLKVDEAIADQQVQAIVAMFKPIKDALATGKVRLPNPPVSVGYSLVGMAAENYKPDALTEVTANVIAREQKPDGSFPVVPGRPPLEHSTFTGTALSIRALQYYGKDSQDRIERGRQWLENAKPSTTEDQVMQLLGMTWAKSNPARLKAAGKQLRAEQRADGGWSQLPYLESDAYATGQALTALNLSGQLNTSDLAYQRGIAYLLRTQFEDGSWLVRTRSNPVQKYKESGFPHGRHQWISAAGTSWAVMALALTQPVSAEQMSKVSRSE
jgi:N-acyl-D-amino-acid deacylase